MGKLGYPGLMPETRRLEAVFPVRLYYFALKIQFVFDAKK